MKIYENYGFGKWREGCGTLRSSGGDNGGGSEMICIYDARGNGTGGVSPTLTGDHENRVTDYVRRLTPLECNRLQGFPDGWGDIPYKDDMSDEEYAFWINVRNTHIAITGKSPKSFTKKSIIDWYNKLHTDSAEYKMWGNGVAEPCVTFVMSGIAEALAGKFDK